MLVQDDLQIQIIPVPIFLTFFGFSIDNLIIITVKILVLIR